MCADSPTHGDEETPPSANQRVGRRALSWVRRDRANTATLCLAGVSRCFTDLIHPPLPPQGEGPHPTSGNVQRQPQSCPTPRTEEPPHPTLSLRGQGRVTSGQTPRPPSDLFYTTRHETSFPPLDPSRFHGGRTSQLEFISSQT